MPVTFVLGILSSTAGRKFTCARYFLVYSIQESTVPMSHNDNEYRVIITSE